MSGSRYRLPADFVSALGLSVALMLGASGCRTTSMPQSASATEASGTLAAGNGSEILKIKDANSAADLLGKLKKFDAQKSTATTRVWEGRAELNCQVERFEGSTETQCWMVTIDGDKPTRDYIFNLSDVNAEIMNDLMVLRVQEVGQAKIKRYTGVVRLVATKAEFSIAKVKRAPPLPVAPVAGRTLVELPFGEDFKLIKKFDAQASSATERVWQGRANLTCLATTLDGRTDTHCWMVTMDGDKPTRDRIFSFIEETADIMNKLIDLPVQNFESMTVKSYTGVVRMVATEDNFILSAP